jgi:PAS domain S-box-containing protein
MKFKMNLLKSFRSSVTNEIGQLSCAIDDMSAKHKIVTVSRDDLNHEIKERKLAEKALNESENKYRTLFEQSANANLIIEGDKFVDCNKATLKMLGYKNKKDLLETHPAELSPEIQPDGRNSFEKQNEILSTVFDQGSHRFEWDHKRKNGEVFPVEVLLTAVPFGERKFIHCVWRDITERKQAEEILKKSEERYRIAFNQQFQLMALLSPEGHVLEINDLPLKIQGSNRKDIVGKPFWQCPAWKDLPEWQEIIKNRIKQVTSMKEPLFVEDMFQTASGEIHYVDAVYKTIRGSDDSIDYILAQATDITERKEAEKAADAAHARINHILASSPAVLYSFDATGDNDPTFISENVRELFGYEPSEYLEDRNFVSDRIHPEDTSDLERGFSRLLKEGHLVNEYRFRRKDGSYCWVGDELRVIYDEAGEPVEIVGSWRDISAHKQREEELSRYQEHLEDLVRERTYALQEAKNNAETADQAKRDFLVNMSHEIRTPMNAVTGLSHLAMQTELTEQQSDYLTKINSSALALLGIINDILDFSKIEAGKIELDSVAFNLNEVLDRISTIVAYNASEKGLEFIFSQSENVPDSLIGDPLRLGQILLNLVTNAVKFTDKGDIIVSIELIEQTTNRVMLKFSVQDTGIGLSKKQAKKLFKAFSQADTSTTRVYGGTGLGLSISNRLTELMGGEIGVESELNKGSTFWFTADLGYETSAKVKSKSLFVSDLQGMRVLIVDDNDSSREILSKTLRDFSLDVSTVASGEEALEIIAKVSGSDGELYELILMDWKMPGMDGIEVSRLIKENKQLSHIPTIIMVTAYGQLEVKQQAEEIGLEGFIVKPVTPSAMLDVIMTAFGQEQLPGHISQKKQARDTDAIEDIIGAKVLLVEDNKINQQVERELLEGNGLDVMVASNGQAALVAVKKVSFDIVFMDLEMPIMDGYQATCEIRKDSKFNKLPIIALTAHAMEEFREKCLQVGMNDHLSKPVDPDDLFDMLVKWIVPKSRTTTQRLITQPSIKKDELPKDLPGINIESGLRKIGGSHILFKKLLKEFHQDYQDATNALTTSLADNNRETAQRLVHTLKGVAGSIGADPLYKAASELEAGLKNKRKKNFKKLIEAFDEALKLVIYSAGFLNEDISTKRSDRDAETKIMASVDRHKLETLLLELDGLLINGDPMASEQLDRIKDIVKGTELQLRIQCIVQQIDNYDFDEAHKTLAEIGRTLDLSMSHV